MRGPQQVDERALDEAQAAQVADLLQLQLQNLRGGGVQPVDLLLRQAEALHQFDVAQRFGGRPGQRRGLFDDGLLHRLDLAAQQGTQAAQQRNGEQIRRPDRPVHAATRRSSRRPRRSRVVNSRFTAMAISFSTSVRTFCSLPSVSPLR